MVIGLFIACLFGLTAAGCSESSAAGPATSGPRATRAPNPSTSLTVPETTSTTSLPTTTVPPPSPAEELLRAMTLREKAAQTLLLTIQGTTVSTTTQELLQAGPPGGILLLGHNVDGAEQTLALTRGLQAAEAESGSTVGLFIAVDQEGGLVQRIHEGVPEVPRARTLGDSSSPEEAAVLAAETAEGLLTLGVNMNLAPVADVVADPKSFLYPRAFGGDPQLVSAFISAITEAYAERGLISVVKHFPGHGSATGNTHAEAVVSEATQTDFETVHLPPFQAAFAAGAEGTMIAHVVAAAYDAKRPASQSEPVIEGLLRRDLGFAGLVVSDDLEMAAATGSADAGPESAQGETTQVEAAGEAAVASLRAGCDLLICTGTLETNLRVLDAIIAAVENGDLSRARLEEAALAVLELKLRHGIAAPPPTPDP